MVLFTIPLTKPKIHVTHILQNQKSIYRKFQDRLKMLNFIEFKEIYNIA